jgi:hypothetical protein
MFGKIFETMDELTKYRRPALFAVGTIVIAVVVYNYGIAGDTNKQISYVVQNWNRFVLHNGFVASL